MLLGFTHFFGGQRQKRSKFSDLGKFRPRNALQCAVRVNSLKTNRSAIFSSVNFYA